MLRPLENNSKRVKIVTETALEQKSPHNAECSEFDDVSDDGSVFSSD